MSEANVELAYQGFDALNRRDLPAYLALMDADVEAVPRMAALEGGYQGHDGIRRRWGHLVELLPDIVLDIATVRDHGDLTVIAGRMRGYAAGSNTPLDEPVWTVAEWRDGSASGGDLRHRSASAQCRAPPGVARASGL